MKKHLITITLLSVLTLLPHLVCGQPSVLSNRKISQENRDFFQARWTKDSLETERFLTAYALADSRVEPTGLPADTAAYSKSKAFLRLRPMRQRLDSGWNSMLQNFSLDSPRGGNSMEVIRQAFNLSRELEKVTIDEYPFMNSDYMAISRIYYNFNDSARLVSIVEKVLSHPITAFADPSRMQAGILMGRYMTILGHREQAIAYLLGSLECEDRVTDRKLYNAMALANLGISNVRFRKFNATLPLFEKSLPVLKQAQANELIKEVYRSACLIYMEEDMREKAVEMHDSLSCYRRKAVTEDPVGDYEDELFKLQYLNYTQGSIRFYQAGISLLTLELRNHLYNPVHIINVAEEVYNKEAALKASELASLHNRQFATLGITLILLSAFLIICGLYRKKQKAYRILVQKNKQWAGDNRPEVIMESATFIKSVNHTCHTTYTDDTDKQNPTEKETEFFNCIHQLMADQQIYRDSTLTLETLARRLGVNRETVSRSINRTTGKNFTRFLNEYRIKESIRILSASRNQIVNYEELSEQTGFNNRTTFYRVFKQITGLTPNEFKNNG